MRTNQNFYNESEKNEKSPVQQKKPIDSNIVSYSVEEKFPCQCSLCTTSKKNKTITIQEDMQPKQKSSTNDRDFIFIVSRLVQESFSKTLNIQIQDTIYFEKGEPQSIIQSIKDGIDRPYQFRIQQWKGSLSKLMQYMNNRRKKICSTNIDLMGIKDLTEKSKEAVLIKYDDDSAQIMTESEFFTLMSKRKGDKIWFRVFYIQNYIKQKAFLTHRIIFNRDRDQNHKYFERSAMETKIILGEVISASSEYISQSEEDEFLRNLKDKSVFEYLRYMSFKIVQFLDILDDTIIKYCTFEWQQDDQNNFQFFNAYNIHYDKRPKEVIITKPRTKKDKSQLNESCSESEEEVVDARKMYNKQYQLRQMARNAQKKLKLQKQHLIYKDCPKVSQWQSYMKNDYYSLLKSVGIDKDQFNIREDNQSELTFKYLHPEINIDFQKMMKDQTLFNKMKKQLFSDNNKSKPISQSKMLNSFFLTPEKKQRSRTVSKQPRQDLISTLNQSSIKKSIRSVDRTVSEFRYDVSRNGKRSTKTLNKILGLA